jgi:Uma2 family endonuclease
MAKPQPRPWTLEEFLAWEQTQEDKFELVDGVVFAMAGGTGAHATIAVNVIGFLFQRLQGGRCRPYNSDMKVVGEFFSAYPDVSVSCPPVDDQESAMRYPTVIVEVTSSSTKDRDLGSKWANYREIASLQHYLLIDQDRCAVELRTRDGKSWRFDLYDSMDDQVELSAIAVRLAVSEIYMGVKVGGQRRKA